MGKKFTVENAENWELHEFSGVFEKTNRCCLQQYRRNIPRNNINVVTERRESRTQKKKWRKRCVSDAEKNEIGKFLKFSLMQDL